MTIQQLRYFLALCEDLNYTRTAGRLYLSRQALRLSIAALEHELCGPLFINVRNHLALTEKGQRFRAQAAPVVEQFERMCAQAYQDIRSPALRLGISVALVPSYLPMLGDVLEQFRQQYPGIPLETTLLSNDAVCAQLQNGTLDAGLVMDLGGCAAGLARTALTRHTAALLVPHCSPFWGRSSIAPAELDGQLLLVPGLAPEPLAPLWNTLRQAGARPKVEIGEQYYQVLYRTQECNGLALDHLRPLHGQCSGRGTGRHAAHLRRLFAAGARRAPLCPAFVQLFAGTPAQSMKEGTLMHFYGTIGPACASAGTLRRLVDAGMTGLRMNLSHGALAEHADWLAMIHAVGIPDLLIDLQGPELRVGRLASPVILPEGGTVQLGAGGIPCPVQLVQAARPGQQLLLDDGKLLVEVTAAGPDALVCTVLRGGVLQSRKSIAAPGLSVPMPTLTSEDLANLRIAASCGVTGVMLPFVRGKQDILALRQALAEAGAPQIRIFAKIENLAGVQALPEFLSLVDEVVIARGDLGNAMPLWELPRCQKQLSAACRAAGVPFMVVTQMLDSMCTRAVPTRAEVSDIYNAVLDGASSLMLTGETAAGQYPVQAMEFLVRTANTAL